MHNQGGIISLYAPQSAVSLCRWQLATLVFVFTFLGLKLECELELGFAGPGGAVSHGKITGMPIDDLVRAWDLPFASEDASKGGCAALKPGTQPSAPY